MANKVVHLPVVNGLGQTLRTPFGWWLTVGAGLVSIGSGIAQFVETKHAGFRRDFRRAQMTRDERRVADFLGRFGMFARGVTFAVVGWFLGHPLFVRRVC